MKKLGLIGKTLRHSWSQQWFEELFRNEGITDAEYRLYEMPSVDGLRQWATDNGISGFNVTIPYKELVIKHLDETDEVAEAVGAVNCVVVRDGRLIGHNTDAPAFRDTLKPQLRPWHTDALVLGTGGAAKAVAHALRQMGVGVQMVSRTPKQHPLAVSYAEARTLAQSHYLIVNATPVGMFPHDANSPWPYPHELGAKHLCYDLIYNPAKTRFLREAEQCGAQTYGGLSMLWRQARLSWNFFSQTQQ